MTHYEIYLITAPGYWYIGSASGRTTATRRFDLHQQGKGNAMGLSAKMLELGLEAFEQTVLEAGVGNPIEAEQRWYDFYLTYDSRQTLNGRRPGRWDGWMTGKTHAPETLARMRKAMMGNTYSKGKKVSDETKMKMSMTRRSADYQSKLIKVSCAECGLTSYPGPVATHQRWGGHSGVVQ